MALQTARDVMPMSCGLCRAIHATRRVQTVDRTRDWRRVSFSEILFHTALFTESPWNFCAREVLDG